MSDAVLTLAAREIQIGKGDIGLVEAPIGLAATLQLCATIPNFLITEYFVNLEEIGNAIARDPWKVEDGYIQVPTASGLGMELDEEALARYPYEPFPARSPRQYDEEGP